MIGIGGSFNEVTESDNETYQELNRLKEKLREYLRRGSCDGVMERKQLRNELAALIGAEYDNTKHAIK